MKSILILRLLAAVLVLALGAASLAQAAKKPRPPKAPRVPAAAPLADSVTVALWRFDETLGLRVGDSGPFRLTGTAGPDTRADFGRYRNARIFQNVPQSFVFVPYNPVMNTERHFTIEAWVYVNAIAPFEMETIAARWSPVPSEQSWAFGIGGLGRTSTSVISPGWFRDIAQPVSPMHLMFGFRSAEAAGTQGFVASSELPLQRWVHVAASVDGEVVRLWVDGRLDGQFATTLGIRATEVPLTIGSALDPHRLTDFGGDLRVDPAANVTLFYQFDGLIDEVRLSNAARSTFDSAGPR
jgi:hypothetical protein